MRRTLAEAATAIRGVIAGGDGAAVFDGASFDSRTLEPRQLFFALEGERTDGHRFAADAVARGAAAAVVHRDPGAPAGTPLLEVADTYEALHELTRHLRRQVPERLVAITGSAGKTTTKELLAAMLARRYRVARSPGNLNNLYGFPLSLLNIPDDTEWMVAEMGMSTPGELGKISRLGRPDVAVFTNVRPVHLEFFDDLRAIAESKAEILEGLDPDGLVVANAGDPEVSRIARRHGGKIVWYGLEEALQRQTEVRAEGIVSRVGGSVFTLVTGDDASAGGESGGRVEIELPLLGRHNVENFLAAAAAAWSLGVPLEEIAAAVREVRPAPMRGVIHQLTGGVIVVDDSYNSNPVAAANALDSVADLAGRGRSSRRLAVLGDMLELGAGAEGFHAEVGRRAAERGFSPVIGVGELSRSLCRAAAAAGADVEWFADAEAAAAWLVPAVAGGDLILVKGSRGIGLDRVARALLEDRAPMGDRA